MKSFSFLGQTTFSSIFLLGIILNCEAFCSANDSQADSKNQMKRATVDGIELEYEIHGNGEPVVLIHAGVFADWFKPLMAAGMLPERYRVISYHRVGYAGSSRLPEPVSLKQQVSHVLSLMNYLGIKRAHIVGHSSGANIALQLALDAPEAVQTLALLEPALKVVKGAQERAAAFALVHVRYSQGDKTGAIDAFMSAVAGPDYRADLDRALPGAFDQAVADADTFLGQELPALQAWSFTAEDAARIRQPALSVIGEKNVEVLVWKERHEMILTWLPNAQPFVLAGATHLLHLQNSRGMVDGLTTFFASHPISLTP